MLGKQVCKAAIFRYSLCSEFIISCNLLVLIREESLKFTLDLWGLLIKTSRLQDDMGAGGFVSFVTLESRGVGATFSHAFLSGKTETGQQNRMQYEKSLWSSDVGLKESVESLKVQFICI